MSAARRNSNLLPWRTLLCHVSFALRPPVVLCWVCPCCSARRLPKPRAAEATAIAQATAEGTAIGTPTSVISTVAATIDGIGTTVVMASTMALIAIAAAKKQPRSPSPPTAVALRPVILATDRMADTTATGTTVIAAITIAMCRIADTTAAADAVAVATDTGDTAESKPRGCGVYRPIRRPPEPGRFPGRAVRRIFSLLPFRIPAEAR